eukprot:2077060-Pyramimonas_sp.AAC.1
MCNLFLGKPLRCFVASPRLRTASDLRRRIGAASAPERTPRLGGPPPLGGRCFAEAQGGCLRV